MKLLNTEQCNIPNDLHIYCEPHVKINNNMQIICNNKTFRRGAVQSKQKYFTSGIGNIISINKTKLFPLTT